VRKQAADEKNRLGAAPLPRAEEPPDYVAKELGVAHMKADGKAGTKPVMEARMLTEEAFIQEQRDKRQGKAKKKGRGRKRARDSSDSDSDEPAQPAKKKQPKAGKPARVEPDWPDSEADDAETEQPAAASGKEAKEEAQAA